jgi:hypothetical protein
LAGCREKLGMNTKVSSDGLKGIEKYGGTGVERRLISTWTLT